MLIRSLFILLSALFLFYAHDVRAENLDAVSAQKMIREYKGTDLVVLDIRTPFEIKQSGYIKGAIFKNAYDRDFLAYIKGLDKKKTYIIYCHSGYRSTHVYRMMVKDGYKVYHIPGGIMEWTSKKLPLEQPK